MSAINPYLQAAANFASQVAKEGDEAVINGTFDRFIERLAKFLAWTSATSSESYLDYHFFDALSVDEFGAICFAYGITIDIEPVARDWFVTNYKREYNRFLGWED